MNKRTAVLIPCFNEELTIEKVIKDFQAQLPNACIYVYDNNSSDNTFNIAKNCGAIVKREYRQGKGNVLRSMFRDIEADVYVLVDGDGSHSAKFVDTLIQPILNNEADVVIGERHSNGTYKNENKRRLHVFGNNIVRGLINQIFKTNLKDIMSGYRVLNKKFVKNMPIISDGFEFETEMTLHSLDKKFIIKEFPTEHLDRPPGSVSTLNTYKDGIKVLKTILWIFKDYQPLVFFSLISMVFFILGLVTGVPVLVEFFKTSSITAIPSAILSVGLILISIFALFSGFILDTIVKQHRDSYELNLIRWVEKENENEKLLHRSTLVKKYPVIVSECEAI